MSDLVPPKTKEWLHHRLLYAHDKFVLTLCMPLLYDLVPGDVFARVSMNLIDPDTGARKTYAQVGARWKWISEDPIRRAQFESGVDVSATARLITEMHEWTQRYCRESKQTTLHVAQPFYQFTRTLRNLVSHGGGGWLEQWPDELNRKGVTEVTWRHRTISRAMLGTAITFSRVEVVDLLQDHLAFVEQELS